MRIVLRDNIPKITEKSQEELMPWSEFEKLYHCLENFEYPHKDKLLDFIKYYFLDHIVSENLVVLNFQAFKEHLTSRRPGGAASPSVDSRNGSNIRSGRKASIDSSGSGREEALRRRLLATAGSDDEERAADEERMLDIAE